VLSVIVAKVVVVFLTWLNLVLKPVPIGAVLLIFLLTGIAMFLIPVIPGVPVYVCAGVLIPTALMSEEEIRDTTSAHAPTSWWSGLLLGSMLAVSLKFCAIVIQQEGIGRFLGARKSVRATVGVNSTLMRAARFVLTRPGCSFSKSMLLCGGPDWPTSVITGILKLSCVSMLVGSLPVVFVILPSVGSGACLMMKKRPGWEVWADLVTMLAIGSQVGASIGVAAVIDRATSTFAHEIAQLPLDTEVAALDEQQAAYARAWRDASDWRRPSHPLPAKLVAIAAAAVGMLGCHLAVLTRCFVRVSVADEFDGPPLFSNPLRVVNGLKGWAVVGSFAASSALLFAHRRWMAARAHAELRAAAAAESAPAPPQQDAL
jgi:hypothetical protein